MQKTEQENLKKPTELSFSGDSYSGQYSYLFGDVMQDIFFVIHSSIVGWQELFPSETFTTVKEKKLDEIEFPAVTICPQGSVKDILDNVLFKQFTEYVANKTL